MAAHYDNQKVALLLLEKGASPHATAKVSFAPTAAAVLPSSCNHSIAGIGTGC